MYRVNILRKQAATFRDLAREERDTKIRDRLQRFAAECEALAQELDRGPQPQQVLPDQAPGKSHTAGEPN